MDLEHVTEKRIPVFGKGLSPAEAGIMLHQ
jgi:hypothetical protein